MEQLALVLEQAAFEAFCTNVAVPFEEPPLLVSETEVTLLVVSPQPTTTTFRLPAV